jgi:hypothetical protein
MSHFLFEKDDNKTMPSDDDADEPTSVTPGPDDGDRGTYRDPDVDPPTQRGEPPTVVSIPPMNDDFEVETSGRNTITGDTTAQATQRSQQSTPSATTSSSPGQSDESSDKTVVDTSDKTVPSVLQKSFVAVLSALGKIADSREIRGKSLNEQGAGEVSPAADRRPGAAKQSPSAKKLHGTVTNIAKYVKTLAADDDEDTEEFYMAAVWLLSFVSLLDQVSTAAKNTSPGDSDKTLEDILGGYGGVKRLVDKNFKPNRQVQDFLMKSESQRRDLETLLSEAGLFSKFVARPIQRWLNSSSSGKKMKAMFEPNGKVMVSVYDAIADMTPKNLERFESELKGLKTRVAAPMAKFLKDLKSEVPPASPTERSTSSGTGTEAPTAPAGEAPSSTSQTSTVPPPDRKEQPTQSPESAAASKPAAKKLSDVLDLSGGGNKGKREKVLDRLKNVDISVTGIGDDLDNNQKGKLKGEIDKYEKELRDKLGREFTAESQRAKNEESVIIERWQRLAGIIK